MRFIQLTLIKNVDNKPVEKQVCILASSVVTMEPEVLRIGDRIIPITFIQASYQGMALALNTTETMDVVRSKLESATSAVFSVQNREN